MKGSFNHHQVRVTCCPSSSKIDFFNNLNSCMFRSNHSWQIFSNEFMSLLNAIFHVECFFIGSMFLMCSMLFVRWMFLMSWMFLRAWILSIHFWFHKHFCWIYFQVRMLIPISILVKNCVLNITFWTFEQPYTETNSNLKIRWNSLSPKEKWKKYKVGRKALSTSRE